jgi:transcription termination/antitermination protein NusG
MNYRDWYCVQVAAGCEKKSRADLLARKEVLGDRNILNVEAPESTELVVDRSGKRKTVKKKILPGYILVQVSKEIVEQEDGTTKKVFPAVSQETIRYTANVIGFAGSNKNKPRMMKPDEVEHLFTLVDDTHLEVKSNVLTDYNEGDILDVVAGPFVGYKCEVISIQGEKILGNLDMFGRIVPAEFTRAQVYKNT